IFRYPVFAPIVENPVAFRIWPKVVLSAFVVDEGARLNCGVFGTEWFSTLLASTLNWIFFDSLIRNDLVAFMSNVGTVTPRNTRLPSVPCLPGSGVTRRGCPVCE